MSVFPRLRELLERQGAAYQVLTHSPGDAAQDDPHPMQLPGRVIARGMVIRHGETLSLAVLPSRARIDLDRLSAALRARVELPPASEVAAAFPECEPGAIPPFGLLFGLKTYVDESLTHDRHVVCSTGTRVEAIRMSFDDYRRIVAPIVLWFAESPARAGG